MNKAKKIILGILYWVWELTWGGLTTIPGLVVTAFCIIFLKGKPHKNGFSYIVEVGGNWGGLELGAVALCGRYYPGAWYEEVRLHEGGHGIQNLWWGPLMLFVICIPSAIRYWYQVIAIKRGKVFPIDWYERAWFEAQADRLGAKIIRDKIEKM